MAFRQLEAFARVVETRSVSRAAEALRLTQSTVSEHVRLLEEEIGGTRLLDRLGRETVPTRAGELLYAYTQRMIELRTEARQALDQFLVKLGGLRLTRHFFVVTHRARTRSPLCQAFLDFLLATREGPGRGAGGADATRAAAAPDWFAGDAGLEGMVRGRQGAVLLAQEEVEEALGQLRRDLVDGQIPRHIHRPLVGADERDAGGAEVEVGLEGPSAVGGELPLEVVHQEVDALLTARHVGAPGAQRALHDSYPSLASDESRSNSNRSYHILGLAESSQP